MKTVETGTVKFFNNEKGFGFIIQDGTNTENFVHKSASKTRLRENDRVRFVIEQGEKGPYASEVEVI